jgi:ABC-type multidrug transport system permease subunit
VLTITILFVLQEIWWWNMDIPFLECGCIGLCILLIFWFKNARRYIAAPISALCIFVTYIWYQAILVNFWL